MRAGVAPRPIVRGLSASRAVVGLGAAGTLLLVAAFGAVALGSVPVSLDDLFRILGHRLLGIGASSGVDASVETIIVDLRLPRVVGAIVVGAGLAAAGAIFQAVLRNPMGDPYLIGTAAGASLGATAAIVLPLVVPGIALGVGSAWLGIGLVQLLAFAGGLGTVLVVVGIARHGGRLPSVTLLLTGYAVSSLLAAGVALLMVASGRALAAIFAWLMGSLAAVGWIDLAVGGPIVLVVFALTYARWRRLNLLLLGDEAAAHLGIDVGAEKLRLTVLASLATSAVVAVAGTIGFVGLVVPHVVRLVVGPDHRLLLPASALGGAVLLVLADLGARLVGGIPVGVVTALVGAPFFLWLLRRSRRVDAVVAT